MNRSNSVKILFLIFAFLSFPAVGFSQSNSEGFQVEGRVNNAQGEKAIGAAILVKGTTIGTVTDTTGYFTLKVPSEESILVISHFSTPEKIEVALKGSKKVVVRFGDNSEPKSQLSDEGFMVHDKVDQLPTPTDGIDGWNRYMSMNIKYPQTARESNTQGTVIVGFEVKEDGTVANVEVIRGIGGECDQEAVRIIAEGPKWIPGKKDDQPVTTQISLPIRFVLSGDPGVSSPSQQNEKAIAERFGKHVIVVGYQAK